MRYEKRSHTARLLESLINVEGVQVGRLALHLGITTTQVEDFCAGRRMPTDLQLRLAALVLAQWPQLGRAAHRVRLQAEAERAFDARETTTHMTPPPLRYR